MEARLLYSTRSDGNMSFYYDFKNNALSNMKEWFSNNNIKYENTQLINALNSNQIFYLDENYRKEHQDLSLEAIKTDAVITKLKDVFLYLKFGDCLPCLIYDKKEDIMAFCHLGKKSIELDLHIKVINNLIDDYGCKLENLKVVIGPSIKKESYLWEDPYQLNLDAWKNYVIKDKDMYQVDLNGYVVDSIIKCGITNIEVSDIDTATNPNMFSHYQDRVLKKREDGRFICGAVGK